MSGRPLADHLTYAVATITQRHAASATTLGLVFFAILAVPFGGQFVGEIDAVLPAIVSASLVAMIVSGVMLRNEYHTTRFAPLAILSVAYWTTAMLLVPYMLSFPHVFSATGFGLGPQVATWLWIVWHAAFVLLVAGYVWSDSYFSRNALTPPDAAEFVRRYTMVTAIVAGATVGLIVVFHARLPALVGTGGYTMAFRLLVSQLLLASACVVMATMIARNALRHTTHLWLCVVLAAFTVDVYLNGEIVNARFTVAWYMGFLEAAVWQLTFLFVQLRHANEQLAAFVAGTRSLVEETQRDALTNLFNRRGFDDRFELALTDSKSSDASIALLALDLDHFKAYNDHFGHLAGDDALRAIAGAMANTVNRPSDACCRVGGEEFAIILAGTDEAGAATVAERVRLAVMRLRIRHAPEVALPAMTVSIGVAVMHSSAQISAKTLYDRADQALYRAKRMGRNRIVTSTEPRDSALRVI
jgi:diguanylate cyclase (GGDEF)-like protein